MPGRTTRSLASSLLVGWLLALSGCGSQESSEPAALATSRINLFGEIRTSDGHHLTDEATIEVRLRPQNMNASDAAPVAVTTLNATSDPPYPFSMVYSPSDLVSGVRYVLDARALTVDGEVTHASRSPVPLPTGDDPIAIDLQISPMGQGNTALAPVVTAYACGSIEVIVQAEGPIVTVFGATDAPLQLKRAVAASGTRYGDEAGNTLWSKGREARLDINGQTLECAEDPAGSRAAAARMAGASVYAVGQEPGWFLTIVPDDRVTLVADYGSTVIVTPPADTASLDGGWRYRAGSGDQQLSIDVLDTPCRDTMSGAQWPRTVSVNLGNRQLTGCGDRWETPREPAGRPG